MNARVAAALARLVKFVKGDLSLKGIGYGFGEQRICGHRLVGHTGGYVGISAEFQMYLDQDYRVVVLSNYDERAAQVVGRRARELIAGK